MPPLTSLAPRPPCPPCPPRLAVLAETRFLDHGNFGGPQHRKVSVIKEPAWLRPWRGRAGALPPDSRRGVCPGRRPGAGLDRALVGKPPDVHDWRVTRQLALPILA